MDKAALLEVFDNEWDRWTSKLAEIDPDVTREPGVSGDWNVHDVVGHVQVYLRYYIAQVRAAFDRVEASDEEINGDRKPMPEGTANTPEARNRALQKTSAPLTWQQLLDEAVWLRERTLAFIDARTDDELNEDVGWLEFWNPDVTKPDDLQIHIRRLSEAPAAVNPVPVWKFVLPDGTEGHMSEHLGQIRSWLWTR